jgi:intein/homing endonuclease
MKQLLVEKYRPTTIDEYKFQNEDVERVVMKWINSGEIPNIMMTSETPGSGKTTLSRILVSELGIDQTDVKTINASLVNGIGFIREELEPWLKKTAFSNFKIVQIEECLHEDEKVRIGTVDDWKAIRIGDLSPDVEYDVVSVNMETGEQENDTGSVISDKIDEVWEIELEDGRTVHVTEDHPMLVLCDGVIVEKTIADGLSSGDMIVSV